MSRRIYEMECREERARQARVSADKALSRDKRHVIGHANDVPQADQDVLMDESEKERSIFGKAVVIPLYNTYQCAWLNHLGYSSNSLPCRCLENGPKGLSRDNPACRHKLAAPRCLDCGLHFVLL